MSEVTFQKGKKKREELELPRLRFIVADQWIDAIGEKAFCAWLKFHTWVDRTDANREYDKIPYTLEDVAEKLGMSKSTLYRVVIKPLWEHYLIDLMEYEESERKGQKPVNIIVYESPMNKHETEIKPLEKLRDWSKDYGSSAQIFGRKGGRPKKADNVDVESELDELFGDEPTGNTNECSDRFKIETAGEGADHRFKNKTVYRFKNETVTVSKIKPNNLPNKRFILANKPNNKPNLLHNVVVVEELEEYKGLFAGLFKETPTDNEVIWLLNKSVKHGRDLGDAIRRTKQYDDLLQEAEGEKVENPVGAVYHEIVQGWNMAPLIEKIRKKHAAQPTPPEGYSPYNWLKTGV